MHHKSVHKAFNYWAASLPEPNFVPSASTVRSRGMTRSIDVPGDGFICADGGGCIPFAEEEELSFVLSHSK